jgi:hypothetical protein
MRTYDRGMRVFEFDFKMYSIINKILAKSQGLNWRIIRKPIDLQKEMSTTLLHLIELIKINLHPHEYTLEEVANILGTSQEELIQTSLTQNTAEC